jgi:predicted AAA+ superfamily ATPase
MGARQVGKTWLMEEFARNEYAGNTVSVNLMKNESLRARFDTLNLDSDTVVDVIQLATGKRIIPGKTLLVIDEIQEAPRALTALKYLQEEKPELVVMVAGSLLGLAVKRDDEAEDQDAAEKSDARKASYPVGKVDYLDVTPMSFEEFLWAIGEEMKAEYIAAEKWSAIEGFHEVLIDLVRRYYLVGGMPEAVKTYAETRDFSEVRKVQKRILRDYDEDFAKHAKPRLLAKIRLVWESIPAQLAKENKKFIYTALRSGARAREYEIALAWLRDAGLVHTVANISTPKMPLKSYEEFGNFKLYIHDVGLLAAMCDMSSSILLDKTEVFTTFNGALVEQYVLEELVALGVKPYYWSPDNARAEIEFLVQGDREIYPLEAKAGTNLRAASLKSYYDRYAPSFEFRVSMQKRTTGPRIEDIPLYGIPSVVPLLKHGRR